MQLKIDKEINCPLCESNDITLKFTKDKIPYYLCNTCTFLFSKPIINENFHESINGFEDAYIKYFNTNVTDKLNFDVIFNWLKPKFNLNEKKLVDIGCGSGKFVNYLRDKNSNAIGIEPSKPLYDKYLNNHDYFFNSTLEEFGKNKQGEFEIITLFDVLEHIETPVSFMEGISALQSTNDYLIIEIPLWGSLHSTLLGKRWHFFNKYHYSYYSKKRLLSLLNFFGYSLIDDRYRGKYYHLNYLVKYFFFFIFKKEIKLPKFLEKYYIPINTYDIYLACFKKD